MRSFYATKPGRDFREYDRGVMEARKCQLNYSVSVSHSGRFATNPGLDCPQSRAWSSN